MKVIRIGHLKAYPSINLSYMAHTFRAIMKDKGLISYGVVYQKGKHEAKLVVVSEAPADILAYMCQDYCPFVRIVGED